MTNIQVRTRGELLRALEEARPGQVILLAETDYGSVALKGRRFPGALTIRSQDRSKPATIGSLKLDNVENLTFQSIRIGHPLADGEPPHTPYALITESTNILFDDVHVHGSLDGDAGNDGYGIVVRGSRSIGVTGSTFEQLGRGLVFDRSSDIDVSGNRFRDLRTDGVNFAMVTKVVVDGNHFADFYPVGGDHADAIQFWTTGTTAASSDIRITNNVIFQGRGGGMQGIFMRDESEALPYANVVIANNLIYVSSQYNGITVMGGGRNVDILGNTVLSLPDDAVRVRIRVEDIIGGRIEGNVADIYLPKNLGEVAVSRNLFLEDSPRESRRIPNLSGGAATTVEDLLMPGFGYQPPNPSPDKGSADGPDVSLAPSFQGLRRAA